MRVSGLTLLAVLASGLPAAAQTDSSFAALAARAAEARDADRLDEAIGLYRKALALQPDWGEGWWSLGTLLYDRDAYAQAAGALQNAVRLSPGHGVAFVMLGLAEARLGRAQAALEHIEQGRKLGIGDDAGLRRVMLYTEGTLRLEAGQFGKAQEALDLLAREAGGEEELIVALGLSVLGIRPSDLPPGDNQTREMVRRAGRAESAAARQTPEAPGEYERFAADYSKIHNVQFAYGRFLLANHRDDQAVQAFRREISNSPQHLLARLGIAGIEVSRDPAAGLPYAEQAVQLAPGLAEAHYLLGALLLNTGAAEKAIPELETAQRLSPAEAKIYFQLGRAYANANRREDAARARAEFLRLEKQ